ncbi:MAG: hypothetical protein ACI9BD_000458 [Candidatus Marinamargulisbacteria bacterium]|jgi:hypothetical protein
MTPEVNEEAEKKVVMARIKATLNRYVHAQQAQYSSEILGIMERLLTQKIEQSMDKLDEIAF